MKDVNKRLTNLISSLEKKIDNLNKEKVNKKQAANQNTIEVVCSQDDIERTIKRKSCGIPVPQPWRR